MLVWLVGARRFPLDGVLKLMAWLWLDHQLQLPGSGNLLALNQASRHCPTTREYLVCVDLHLTMVTELQLPVNLRVGRKLQIGYHG